MIARDPILLLLWEHGINTELINRLIADEHYECPTERWIAGPFATGWTTFRDSLGLRFKLEESDCDDFALWAHAYASYLHMRTEPKPPNRALAFGEFWYVRAAGGGHAINFAVQPGQLIFFEPQESRIVQLSKQEVSSCVGFRL